MRLFKKYFLLTLVIFIFTILFSCNKINENEEYNLDKFRKDIHYIQNPNSLVQMIFDGNGKILLKSNTDDEHIGILRDVKNNEVRYLYKVFQGDRLIEKKYEYENGETFYDRYPSYYTEFYDKNGKDIILKKEETFGATMVLNDRIFYYINSNDDDFNNLRVYNTKTKKEITPKHRCIEYFNNKLILSSDNWEEKDLPKEVIICDDNFKELKKFSGYSSIGTSKIGNKEFLRLIKEGNDEKKYYNYLDDKFNLVFKEDVETNIYKSKSSITTIEKEDIEWTFDFDNLKKIGDDRKRVYDISLDYEKKIEKYEHYIQNIKYNYNYDCDVDVKLYNDKVIFVATSNGEQVLYDEELSEKRIGNVISFFENVGLILVDYNKIYDFDLNLVKNLDEETNLLEIKKNDKIFFISEYDKNYSKKDSFILYDSNLNKLMDIKNIWYYEFDDYIIIQDNDGTKVLDENLNIIKYFKDRYLKISKYNNCEHYIFDDSNRNLMGVLDKNFDIVVDGLKNVTDINDNYFTYKNGFKYGLMDYHKNKLIEFSIFDNFNEDKNTKKEVFNFQ